MNKSTTLSISLLSALALMAGAALAEEAPAASPAWITTAAAGLSLARGNTKNLLANGSIKSERKGDANEFTLSLEGNYGETEVTRDGESQDETNVQNAKALAEYRRLFDERNYGYVQGEGSHDHIADVDYRVIVGPGVGRYFIKSDIQNLNAEVGVSYIGDKVGGVTGDRAALRLSQKYDWMVSKTAKVWEGVDYLPTVDDFGNYLLNAEIGAEAAMTAKLSLRVVLQNKYNSEPAPGKKSNDLALIAGLSYTL